MAYLRKRPLNHGSQLSTLLLTFSFLSALLFVYSAIAMIRLMPVYRPLECQPQATSVSAFTASDAEGVLKGTSVSRSLWANPNPYEMHLHQVGDGDIFIKDGHGELRPAGRSVVPILTLPAHSEGSEWSLTSYLELPKESVPDSDPLHIVSLHIISEFRLQAHSDIYFLGKLHAANERQSMYCGFELRPLENNKAGHMVCAHSVEELVIPSADDTGPRTETLEMDPAHLAAETQRRNANLGGVMAMSATVCLALLSCGLASGGARARGLLSGRGPGGHEAAREAIRESREAKRNEASDPKVSDPAPDKEKDVPDAREVGKAQDGEGRREDWEELGTMSV